MKRSVLKSGLAAAIATVMMSCTTAAHAQTTGNTKYIYCQDDTNTTVYTLNEDGKTLTRKVKYEYKRNETGQVIEKKAYRWDACREIWKPAYLLTATLNGTPRKAPLMTINKKQFTVKTATQTCWPTHKTKSNKNLKNPLR